MKRTMYSSKGFTLIEVLIVVAVFGIVMGAVYSLYITNLRTAYTSDETVEVQQNMRIAMDMVTHDLQMAGMLVDYGSNVFPVSVAVDNTGPNNSDGITLNMASATGRYVRLNSDITPAGSPTVFPLTPATNVNQAGDGDVLQVNDEVRIIRPLQNIQPSNEATFTVTAAVRQVKLVGESGYVAPSVTLVNDTGATMSGVEFKRGDIIAKVNANDATTPSPNTIQFAVVTFAAAPATATTDPNCPVNQRCLARRLNNETNSGNPVWQIVAQNITNFQLRYLLDDNKIVPNAAEPTRPTGDDLPNIKAVMVDLSGETVTTSSLSGNGAKTRQLTSVVKLRNRR